MAQLSALDRGRRFNNPADFVRGRLIRSMPSMSDHLSEPAVVTPDDLALIQELVTQRKRPHLRRLADMAVCCFGVLT